MPQPHIHAPERIHLHATGDPFHRVKVTDAEGRPRVTFYGDTETSARQRAAEHGYAVPDRLVYNLRGPRPGESPMRWQSSVRYASNPLDHVEATFHGDTEGEVRDRAELWIKQQETDR